jgi:hypothetical protein
MTNIDFNAQASEAMQGMLDKGYLADAVHARKQDDFQTLTYYIARGLKLDFQASIKFGLIWAVADAIDALEAV